MEGPVTASLPREEVEAIIATVSAFDREPLSEDVLLKAVRYVANKFEVDIREARSEKGNLTFRGKRSGNVTSVRVEDRSRYHCWNYNVMQGDSSEWDTRTTSELVWRICGHPSRFIAKPTVAK
jgi:hypothetical protein